MSNWIGRVRLALSQLMCPAAARPGKLDSLRQRLDLSERRLRAMSDNLPVIITQFDPEGRFIFVKRYVTTVLPQEPESLIGMHLRDITGDDLYNSISGHIDKPFQGQKVSFELCFPVDGADRHFSASYLPELDAAGGVVSVFALFQDITQRKEIEMHQASDELRLRTIADNLPVLIGYVDSNLQFESGRL